MPPPASTPSSTLTTGTPTTTPSLRPVEISLTTLYSNDITGGLVVLGHTITTKGAGGQFSVLTVTDTTVAVTAATTLSTSSSGTPPTSQPSQSTPTVYTTTVYTPTPSHTRNEPQRSNGLQDHAGEVAGIAIGVGLALAFVAFLITFVVMRRKKHTSGPRRHDGEKPNNSYLSAGSIRDPQGDPGSKHPIVTDLSVVAGPNRGLETHLPPSADDSTVRNKISTLNEQIGLHVENFYHKSGIPIPPGAEAGLADFESPYLPGTLALLFQQARSGVPIIKHCLAGLILSRISPSGDPKNTFLPTEFVGLPHALEKTRSGKQKAPGYDEAISRWRVLSSYLMPHPSTLSSYVSSRDAAIAQAVQSFSRAFRPWINSRHSDSDRVHNLTEIMKSAAEQGVWLFSQPSAYRFHWGNPEEVGSGVIPTSPALWKIGDEKGQPLRKVQVMVERGVAKA